MSSVSCARCFLPDVGSRRPAGSGASWRAGTGDAGRDWRLRAKRWRSWRAQAQSIPADLGTYMLAHAGQACSSQHDPRTFIAAGLRRRAANLGWGFHALAVRARSGEGPLAIRHWQAGLKLIADAEQNVGADLVAMDATNAARRLARAVASATRGTGRWRGRCASREYRCELLASGMGWASRRWARPSPRRLRRWRARMSASWLRRLPGCAGASRRGRWSAEG